MLILFGCSFFIGLQEIFNIYNSSKVFFYAEGLFRLFSLIYDKKMKCIAHH